MTPMARIAAALEVRRQRGKCTHPNEVLIDTDWMGVDYAECVACSTVSAR